MGLSFLCLVSNLFLIFSKFGLMQSISRGKTYLSHSFILNSFFHVSVYKKYIPIQSTDLHREVLFPNCRFSAISFFLNILELVVDELRGRKS